MLACHKAFDQELTVGANFALAERLGLDAGKGKVLKGYKGDPERRIGIVAGFAGGEDMRAEDLRGSVRREFGQDVEGEFGFDDGDGGEDEVSIGGDEGELPRIPMRIKGVAIMNAFHPDEVDRVAAAALGLGLVDSVDECASLLYLTGAVREEGLAAARAKGLRVICVGHQVCELWGIKYISELLKKEFPAVDVVVVDEEEEKPAAKEKSVVKRIPAARDREIVIGTSVIDQS